jgi:hypothetical protein
MSEEISRQSGHRSSGIRHHDPGRSRDGASRPIGDDRDSTSPYCIRRKIRAVRFQPILDAVLVSWKVVIQNPYPMAIWAFVIAATSCLGLLALAGSVVIVPVLGHASWHAYRDAVGAEHLPLRVRSQF